MKNIKDIIDSIRPLDKNTMRRAMAYQNRLLKPAGSLGRLETLAIQIAGITGELYNRTERKIHFLFGSDHGVYEEGISGSPQHFTRTLMEFYARGEGCGITVLCQQENVDLKLVDMGIKDMKPHPNIDSRFRLMPEGTRNLLREEAMSRETAERAIEAGILLVREAKRDGYQIVGTGEIGMGNTTPAAACIMAALQVTDPNLAVGRGGGLTDVAFTRKKQVIAEALAKHRPNSDDSIEILSRIGGLDIAGMTGVFLGAAYHRMPVIIDGVISIAAALMAFKAAPNTRDFMIASHLSREPGYALAAEHMKFIPLLNLGMRLGEGSGCPIAMRIVDDALAIMNYMGTFDGLSLSHDYRKELKHDRDKEGVIL